MSNEERKEWTPEQEARLNALFDQAEKDPVGFLGVDIASTVLNSNKELSKTASKKCKFYAKVMEKLFVRDGAAKLVNHFQAITDATLDPSEKTSIINDMKGLPAALNSIAKLIDSKVK